MDEIVDIVFSWQFLLVGILVFLLMTLFMCLGGLLWRFAWMRRVLVWLDAAAPWLPPLFGAGLGAIPIWPRPGSLNELPEGQAYFAMIVLGLLAGLFYEKIWKGVKQVIEARGIDLSLDLPPKQQKKMK